MIFIAYLEGFPVANNMTSNVTRQLARVFLEKFEASRVLSKTVDTQLLSGKFSPRSGSTVDFKRPHDYNAVRTPTGDITGNKSELIAGKATGTVQDFITVATEWDGLIDAVESDQLDQVLAPMATRAVTTLELSLGEFMLNNLGLSSGIPGQATDAWGDVAKAAALMQSVGVPSDGQWCYVMNPFVTQDLADTQSGLASGSNKLVDTAWEQAQISQNFGGFRVMTSNALKTRVSGAISDRAGALAATPDATYATAKDSMQQVLQLNGLTPSSTISAGDIIEFVARYALNQATREVMIDANGNKVKHRCVVVADAVTDGSGNATVTVAGPGIFEANGQYNTVEAALGSGNTLNVLGSASATYQPNLFYHKQAIGLGAVKLNKLYATDTVGTTEDGMSIRVTKYSDGDANKQMVRFDLLPAFACFNPFFGGQGFGNP